MKYIRPPDFKSVREFEAHFKKIEQDITELLTTDGSARTANELNEKLSQALNAAVSYLAKVNRDFTEKELPKAFQEGKDRIKDPPKVSAKEAAEILEKQGFKYAKNSFSRDTYIEIQTATKSAGDGLKSRVNSIIKDLHKTGQDSVYNVQQAIAKDLAQHGILTVTYANGAKQSLRSYAAMAARSARIESVNIGEIGRALQSGTDLVKMTEMPQCCKLCGAYQGKVYSISGKDKRFPALFKTVLKNGYALPHPNCRHEFIPWHEEIEDPADVEKAIKNSRIQYDEKGDLVDVRHQRDIKGYAQWQAGNRQLNREYLEYERMKKYYAGREDEMPYKSLGSFRRASRAQTETYKELRKNLRDILTTDEIDVIITNENIKRSFGRKTVTLQEAINRADPLVANAFDRYQSKLKIINAHYKTTDKQSAHFDPRKGGIYFDIEQDSRPSDSNRKQYQTYFHETGHNLDFVIGKKIGRGYASGSYRSPKFNNYTFNDMIYEEGKEFIETYRGLVANKAGKTIITNEEVYRAIYEDFKGVPLSDMRQLSDILDGITNGEMRKCGYSLGASHTAKDEKYWQKHSVGTEAFAHFASICATNRKKVEHFMTYFPKSYEIFKEIMVL